MEAISAKCQRIIELQFNVSLSIIGRRDAGIIIRLIHALHRKVIVLYVSFSLVNLVSAV